MVISRIAIELAKVGARSLVKYSGKEKKFWSNRYGKTGGRAVRHGLAAGPGIGNLLSRQEDGLSNGEDAKGNGYAPGKPDKARSGFKRNSYGSNSAKYNSNRYRRCSCHRKYRRSSNRKYN